MIITKRIEQQARYLVNTLSGKSPALLKQDLKEKIETTYSSKDETRKAVLFEMIVILSNIDSLTNLVISTLKEYRDDILSELNLDILLE